MRLFPSSVSNLIDIHSHIIPFVDDGADDFEDAKDILMEEYSQGVRTIVATPHLRYGMFDTSASIVYKRFKELRDWLQSSKIKDIELYLSREYYCDERFLTLLDGYANDQDEVVYEGHTYNSKEEIIPFGKLNCILLEFSSNKIQTDEFEMFISKALDAGLTPIIAHAERYPAVQIRPEIVDRMIKLGAYIQVNCDSFLRNSREAESETVRTLLKNKMVDVVSSDVHDTRLRTPNHKKCYCLLEKKYGKKTADDLLRRNAHFLIYNC